MLMQTLMTKVNTFVEYVLYCRKPLNVKRALRLFCVMARRLPSAT